MISLLFFLRNPELPMTVLFPLLWLFWSYNAPLLGGRLERVIGLIAIVGMFIVLAKRRHILPLPPLVFTGLVLLIGAYMTSSLVNSIPNPLDNIVSLTTRFLFLYVAFFLLYTPENLRLASVLLIITGLIGAVIILYLNLIWGFGFFRTYTGFLLARSLGEFGYALIIGGNSLTISAILLISVAPTLPSSSKRNLAQIGAIFLFAMAFVAQFRREILISALLVLLYLIATNSGDIRKPAIWVLLGMGVFYVFALLPSQIFQQRLAEGAMLAQGTDPRLLSLQAGLQAFLQAPFWGTGPTSYEATSYRVLGSGYAGFYYHSYNVFIYFAVEAGIFGLGGLLLILYGVFRKARQSQAPPESPQGWILSSAPGFMIIIVVSFTFGNYYEMSLPWFLMGMILSAARLAEMPATAKEDSLPRKYERLSINNRQNAR